MIEDEVPSPISCIPLRRKQGSSGSYFCLCIVLKERFVFKRNVLNSIISEKDYGLVVIRDNFEKHFDQDT